MINLKQFTFNPFQENTYVVFDETAECVIVDAGCYSSDEQIELVEFIQSNGLKPKYLINTHGHIDHVLGNQFVKDKYGVEILANAEDYPLLKSVPAQAMMFGLSAEPVPEIDVYLNHGDIIRFGNAELEVIHTPGHTKGGICLYSKTGEFLISGDTLFKSSIGRTDLQGGSFDQIIQSITSRLLTLGDNVKVYPGHGEASTIGYEKKNNPFLLK